MRPVWYLTNRLFRGIERAYRWSRGLEQVGALIWLQRTTHRGPARRVGDTVLQPGTPIGIIHFDNQSLQAAQADRARPHGGFVFARLLFPELQALSRCVRDEPKWQDVAGFLGITWIPPHGRSVGFVAEPLADDGWRTRWLVLWFRLLLWAFNPATARAVGRSLRPHEFWLSRDELLSRFEGDLSAVSRADLRRVLKAQRATDGAE